MSFGSLGKALDCFRLSILFENKRFGEVDEQIACENNKEGLANRTSDADLEDDRNQISDEKKEVCEVKNPQARSAFAFVFDFSIAGREPFGEDQDEEVDRQSEMVHRSQHFEVIPDYLDRFVQAEGCERYLHLCSWLRKRIGIGLDVVEITTTSKEIPSVRSREKIILSFRLAKKGLGIRGRR